MELILAFIVFSIIAMCLYLNRYVAIFILILCTSVGACSYINKKLGMSDDWLGEELIEDIIKKETDLSIDLTPESKEVLH